MPFDKGVASTSSRAGGDCDLIGSPSATVYLFLGVGLTLDCLFCDCLDGSGRLLGLVPSPPPPPLDKLIKDMSGEATLPRPRLKFKFEFVPVPVREEVGETARVIELAVAMLLGEEVEGSPEMDIPRVLLLPDAGGELGGENESFGLA